MSRAPDTASDRRRQRLCASGVFVLDARKHQPRTRTSSTCVERDELGSRRERFTGSEVAREPGKRTARDEQPDPMAGPKPVGDRIEVDPQRAEGCPADAQVTVGDVAGAAFRVDVADPDGDVGRRRVRRVGELDVGHADDLEVGAQFGPVNVSTSARSASAPSSR